MTYTFAIYQWLLASLGVTSKTKGGKVFSELMKESNDDGNFTALSSGFKNILKENNEIY